MTIKLDRLCKLIGSEIPQNAEQIEISGVAAIEDAGPDDVTFIANLKYKKYLSTTRAGAVIISKDIVSPDSLISLIVDDPYFAFLKVLEVFNCRSPQDIASGIHVNAIIDPDAVVGNNVSIGAFAIIGPGVAVGSGTTIGPCTVILKKSKISALLFGHNHDGRVWSGRWGISRVYDGGTSTGKGGKPNPHRVIDLSRDPAFDYDAQF